MIIPRRPAALLAAALTVLGTVGLVAAGPAAAAAGLPGSYVPFPSASRVASSRTVKAGHVVSVRVAGVGHVPRTGAGSVAVTITAVGATTTGGLVAYGAHRPGTTNLQYGKGASSTNTAVVVLSGGRLHVGNTARHGSVKVSVDVAGYYRSGASSWGNPGVFHGLPTARRVASLPVGAGRSVSVVVGGRGGLPAEPGAAAVTLTVTGATQGGALLAHRADEPQQDLPVARFAAHQSVSSFAVVRLTGGRVTLVNTSSRAVHVAVDAAGWYVIGFAQSASAFQTLVPTRVASLPVGGQRTVAVTVDGRGGVPLSGVSAVLAEVSVAYPAVAGGLKAWRAGTHAPRTTTVLQFARHRSTGNEVLLPVSAGGHVDLRNTGSRTVAVTVDVHGYVPTTNLAPPTSGSAARYVRNINGGAGDAAMMNAEGKQDAAAGASFVLLDVGAQANNKNGVVLSATNTEISYAQLRTAVDGYLAGFATGGHRGTVAIGTNNSGSDWTNYTPSERGSDWATQVVQPLAAGAPAGVGLIGANDLEAAFVSTELQAEQWKAAFLAHVPGSGTALVYNGSADFCPKTWTRAAACNFGWTEAKLAALAGGSRTYVLPQVYFGYMATQWAMIDATSGGRLRFLGALTEYAMNRGSLTAGQGWTALQRAVSSVTRTGIAHRVADIHA